MNPGDAVTGGIQREVHGHRVCAESEEHPLPHHEHPAPAPRESDADGDDGPAGVLAEVAEPVIGEDERSDPEQQDGENPDPAEGEP